MRRTPWWLLALFALAACGGSDAGPAVAVIASGIPEAGEVLQGMVILGGTPASDLLRFEGLRVRSGRRTEASFELRLPQRSALQVALAVRDALGCVIATGAQQTVIGAARSELVVRLTQTRPQPPPCKMDEVPVLTDVSPDLVGTRERAPLTLRGFGFFPDVRSVSIAGKPALSVTWRSPLEIIAVAPEGEKGPAEIVVEGTDGKQARLPGRLSYYLTSLQFRRLTYSLQQTRSASVADINGDGLPDLLYTDPTSAKIMVRLNTKDRKGEFPNEIEGFAAERQFGTMAVGDLDGDGKADAAVGAEAGSVAGGLLNRIRICLSNGDGTFKDGGSVVIGQRPEPLAIADMNGDGLPDIVMLTEGACGSGTGCLVVAYNQGQGRFSATDLLRVGLRGVRATRLAVADLDGNGSRDVVTTSPSGRLSLFLNQGEGVLQDGGIQVAFDEAAALTKVPNGVLVADVNRDGRLDLLIDWRTPTAATVLLGQGGGIFQTGSGAVYPQGGGAALAGHGDLDGDGWPDLLLSSTDPGGIHVLVNRRDGTFPNALPPPQPTMGLHVGTQAVDVNQDGLLDIVSFAEAGSTAIRVFTSSP